MGTGTSPERHVAASSPHGSEPVPIFSLAVSVSPAAIEASYAACRKVVRRAGSNFPAGFVLLPRTQRRAMDALYAFMRHSDDLVDQAGADHSPREALARWRADLENALRQGGTGVSPVHKPAGSGVSPVHEPGGSGVSPVLSCFKGDSPIFVDTKIGTVPASTDSALLLPALADAVGRFCIPPEYLCAVLDGLEMDLARPRYQTFADLTVYCERVASAVGLACIHIWGFRGPEALEPARQAGIAMQLTNILRDLREDAQAGRVYLPLDDLRQCGYAIEQLEQGVTSPAFRRLMEMEIGRAEEFYRGGAALLDMLDPAGRRIFGLMMATYHALLAKIARRPEDVFRRRIRLSRPRKLLLAARWTLLPSPAGRGSG